MGPDSPFLAKLFISFVFPTFKLALFGGHPKNTQQYEGFWKSGTLSVPQPRNRAISGHGGNPQCWFFRSEYSRSVPQGGFEEVPGM